MAELEIEPSLFLDFPVLLYTFSKPDLMGNLNPHPLQRLQREGVPQCSKSSFSWSLH